MNSIKAQELRNLSFEKLKSDRSMFLVKEKERIDMIMINYAVRNIVYNPDWSDFIRQVNKDVKLYKKYDCLAMWLDYEFGLIRYYPGIIERIVSEVGGMK